MAVFFGNYDGIFNTMSILILLNLSFFIGCFSFIWFNTDFLPFYLKLFKRLISSKIYYLLFVDEYFNRTDQDLSYSYVEYLSIKYYFTKNFTLTFILKLLSCPICLCTWMSILACLSCGVIASVGIVFFISRLVDTFLIFFLKIH